MEFDRLLKTMVEKGASDLFVTAGLPPSIKLHGRVTPLSTTPLTPETAKLAIAVCATDEVVTVPAANVDISLAPILTFPAMLAVPLISTLVNVPTDVMLG